MPYWQAGARLKSGFSETIAGPPFAVLTAGDGLPDELSSLAEHQVPSLRRGLRLRGEIAFDACRCLVAGFWPDHPVCHRLGRAQQVRPSGSSSFVRGALQLDPEGLTRSLAGGRRQTG